MAGVARLGARVRCRRAPHRRTSQSTSGASRTAAAPRRRRRGAARRGAWLSFPRWTRLVSRTTKRPRSGSIQSEVPVKPVWPKERGPRSSGPALERARGGVPAEGAAGAGGLRRRPAGEGLRAQDPHAAVGAAVQQHLREDGQVARAGEEPRVPRDPAHRPGVRVVHLAVDQPAAARRSTAVAAMRGSARRERREAGVAHPQRARRRAPAGSGRAARPVMRSMTSCIRIRSQSLYSVAVPGRVAAAAARLMASRYCLAAPRQPWRLVVERRERLQPAAVREEHAAR